MGTQKISLRLLVRADTYDGLFSEITIPEKFCVKDIHSILKKNQSKIADELFPKNVFSRMARFLFS